MKFQTTPLRDAYTVEMEKRGDERGFFARAFCENEFSGAGLPVHFVQINNSLSAKKGTLRGLHYQLPPAAESKIIRCIRGSLYDVIIDLRPDSPTFGNWFGAELTAENRLMMFVPKGFAHGFITLQDNTEAFYLVDSVYSPNDERGIRFDDPRFGVVWPVVPFEISEKDKSWPSFDIAFHGVDRMRGLGAPNTERAFESQGLTGLR